jgi:molecular chaperone GrpE (heat shock protein)
MRKSDITLEFEITEEPHELSGTLTNEDRAPWDQVLEAANRFECRLMDIESSVEKIKLESKAAQKRFFIDLIEEVIDNLDRIVVGMESGVNDPAEQKRLKRFKLIRRKIEEVLAQEHVTPIDMIIPPPGLAVISEAIATNEYRDGTVLSTNWRGWLWKGEVLRKANVVVAKNDNAIVKDCDNTLSSE